MKNLTIATAVICAAALAGPAFAEQSDKQRSDSQQKQQQRTAQQQAQRQSQQRQQAQRQSQQDRRSQQQQVLRAGQRVNLQGTIEGYRPLQLAGEQEKHVVAKVRLDNGRTAVLDLGPVSNLSNQQTQLRTGQRVQAEGQSGRINDLPVLIVDRFVGDGKVTIIAPVAARSGQQQQARQAQQRQQSQQRFTADRDQQSWSQQHIQRMRSADRDRQADNLRTRQQQSAQRGQITVIGRLTDLRDVSLNGLPERHRLAKLQLNSGQTVILDLGTRRTMQDISLQRNEVVMVQGKLGRINGKPVVFADVVGDLARVDRRDQQQAQMRQTSQREQQRQ